MTSTLSSVEFADIFGWVVLSVAIAFSVYGLYSISFYHQSLFVKKRSLLAVYGLNIALLLTVISYELASSIQIRVGQRAALVPYFVVCLLVHCVYCLYNSKLCHIYYRRRWTYCTLQSEWQKLLDSSDSQKQNTNWFLHNNHRYGTYPKILKRFVALQSVLACMTATHFYLYFEHLLHVDHVYVDRVHFFAISAFFLLWLPFMLNLLIFVVMVVKNVRAKLTEDTEDTLYIYWELKIHARILLSVLVVSLVHYVLHHFTVVSSNVFYDIGVLASNIIFLSLTYVSTFGIIYKCKPKEEPHEQLMTQDRYSNSVRSMSRSPDSSPSRLQRRITVMDVLENYLAIHLFMLQLSSEYSMELLLCYIELAQFAKYMKTTTQGKVINGDAAVPEGIPTSGIIQQIVEKYTCKPETTLSDDDDDDELRICKEIAYNLYQKYFAGGSEFEVNIEHDLRVQCAAWKDLQQMQNHETLSIQDMFMLTQKVLSEMVYLLSLSFFRFAEKEEFNKVTHVFTDSNV